MCKALALHGSSRYIVYNHKVYLYCNKITQAFILLRGGGGNTKTRTREKRKPVLKFLNNL